MGWKREREPAGGDRCGGWGCARRRRCGKEAFGPRTCLSFSCCRDPLPWLSLTCCLSMQHAGVSIVLTRGVLGDGVLRLLTSMIAERLNTFRAYRAHGGLCLVVVLVRSCAQCSSRHHGRTSHDVTSTGGKPSWNKCTTAPDDLSAKGGRQEIEDLDSA